MWPDGPEPDFVPESSGIFALILMALGIVVATFGFAGYLLQ